MNPTLVARWLFLALGCGVVFGFIGGCSQPKPEEPRLPTFPAYGKLSYRGQPTGGACITFTPVDRTQWKGPFPTAYTNDDGTFEVQTYSPADGAPAGEYRVTVEWYEASEDDERPDRLQGRYAEVETSKITVKIDPAPTKLPEIRLQ